MSVQISASRSGGEGSGRIQTAPNESYGNSWGVGFHAVISVTNMARCRKIYPTPWYDWHAWRAGFIIAGNVSCNLTGLPRDKEYFCTVSTSIGGFSFMASNGGGGVSYTVPIADFMANEYIDDGWASAVVAGGQAQILGYTTTEIPRSRIMPAAPDYLQESTVMLYTGDIRSKQTGNQLHPPPMATYGASGIGASVPDFYRESKLQNLFPHFQAHQVDLSFTPDECAVTRVSMDIKIPKPVTASTPETRLNSLKRRYGKGPDRKGVFDDYAIAYMQALMPPIQKNPDGTKPKVIPFIYQATTDNRGENKLRDYHKSSETAALAGTKTRRYISFDGDTWIDEGSTDEDLVDSPCYIERYTMAGVPVTLPATGDPSVPKMWDLKEFLDAEYVLVYLLSEATVLLEPSVKPKVYWQPDSVKPPVNPQVNWIYCTLRNEDYLVPDDSSKIYIYTGEKWEIVSEISYSYAAKCLIDKSVDPRGVPLSKNEDIYVSNARIPEDYALALVDGIKPIDYDASYKYELVVSEKRPVLKILNETSWQGLSMLTYTKMSSNMLYVMFKGTPGWEIADEKKDLKLLKPWERAIIQPAGIGVKALPKGSTLKPTPSEVPTKAYAKLLKLSLKTYQGEKLFSTGMNPEILPNNVTICTQSDKCFIFYASGILPGDGVKKAPARVFRLVHAEPMDTDVTLTDVSFKLSETSKLLSAQIVDNAVYVWFYEKVEEFKVAGKVVATDLAVGEYIGFLSFQFDYVKQLMLNHGEPQRVLVKDLKDSKVPTGDLTLDIVAQNFYLEDDKTNPIEVILGDGSKRRLMNDLVLMFTDGADKYVGILSREFKLDLFYNNIPVELGMEARQSYALAPKKFR